MSTPDTPSGTTDPGTGRTRAAGTVRSIKNHGWRLLLLFAVIGLPLWGFGELADEVREGEAFFFDKPVLEYMHALATPGLDHFFLVVSKLGYLQGVVPMDVVLVVALLLMRRYRDSGFAALSIGGSALLNIAAKHYFGRVRPAFWVSLAPETSFSFPSGHAMGSMTLAAVCVLLAWNSRWRWWVVAAALVSVMLVGLSRLYLGVHYPSDILAGWTAALAWTLGVHSVLFHQSVAWLGRFAWRDRGVSPRKL